MKTILKITGILFLMAIIYLSLRIFLNMRDKDPGYKTDLKILSDRSSQLYAGFSGVTITPEVPDRWTDINKDARYRPKDGDTFTDGNGNGKFDPVWIAGFDNARAANGIHDDLWARTMVIDDGSTRLAIVALDVIGFMNNEVIDLRKKIPQETGITYIVIASTHSHEGPDLLGLWGESYLKSGINMKYIEYVKDRIVKSLIEAVNNLRPAYLEVSEELTGAIPLVNDSRKPDVFDSGLRIIRAVDRDNGTTLGSLISWANHPETLWSDNLLITSDFPHYLREGIEKGVYSGENQVKPGIGGIAVFINGAIGGLMTTDPGLSIKDTITKEEYKEPTFEKASALGNKLAILALSAIENPTERIDSAGISLIAKSILLPIENKYFKLGIMMGIFNRGSNGWMKMRSELSVFDIGPLSFATFPGEVYPEIINGGIEAPDGRDYPQQPVEVPSVREMMKGEFKFIIGLANDEIGYIIPETEWDVKPPYTYGNNEAPYGEENSLGPKTASILHRNLKEMLAELNGK